MKQILLYLILISTSTTLTAQVVMTFQAADKKGVTIEKLDSLYKSGMHSDSTKAVFWNKEDEFINAYSKTLQDLAQYLHDNKFKWGKETSCFNRIYYNKNGHIDYFLYNFGKKQITKEKQIQFEVLLNQFIKSYQFPMTAAVNFAQCSPVRYRD